MKKVPEGVDTGTGWEWSAAEPGVPEPGGPGEAGLWPRRALGMAGWGRTQAVDRSQRVSGDSGPGLLLPALSVFSGPLPHTSAQVAPAILGTSCLARPLGQPRVPLRTLAGCQDQEGRQGQRSASDSHLLSPPGLQPCSLLASTPSVLRAPCPISWLPPRPSGSCRPGDGQAHTAGR